MRLGVATLGAAALLLLACSSSSSGTLCESAMCGLGPTFMVRGVTQTAASAPVPDVPVEAAGFIGYCGSANLAEYTLVPPTTTSDNAGRYLFGIEPKRERLGVCLRLRSIHLTDTVVIDVAGVNFIPPPATPETLTVNFVFP